MVANNALETTGVTEPGLMMDAIVQHRYGNSDALEIASVPVPKPRASQVLIEVQAAGIDQGTCHLMTGLPYLIRLLGYGFRRPKQPVPGLDVAGWVVAVGPKVTRFAPGDAVFGIADGSLAQYAVADESKLAGKPPSLTFEQAAVAAVSGITALQALTDVGDLEADQRVLVVGASGGVGSYAVQLAATQGAEVTAIASTSKLEFVRGLGATHTVDYTQQDFTDTDERYDLILDVGGRNSLRRLRSVLAPRGTLVIVGGEGGNKITGGIGRQIGAALRSPFVKHRLRMMVSKEHHTFMERLAVLMEAGDVTPAVQGRFSLVDAPEALRQLQSGEASGKSVIVVGAKAN